MSQNIFSWALVKMNTDNFEFAKSSAPQGVEDYTPYAAKSWNYLNDINSQVYNNSGLTQVQFDLSSLYMGNSFVDVTDTFIVIPTVMCAQYILAATGAPIPPVATGANFATCTLKSNYQHLIHQIELVSDGKVINDTQPFVSMYQHFSLLSQMSATDLAGGIGETLGFSKVLDNASSITMSQTAGVGLVNNKVFGTAAIPVSNVPLVPGVQNANTVNTALTMRAARLVDATGNGSNKLFGTQATVPTIMTSTQLQAELRPYYTVTGSTMVWYDFAVIPLKYLCDCIDKIGLVRKFSTIIRMYVNTGAIAAAVSGANSTAAALGLQSNSSFSNICPFTINVIPEAVANGGNTPANCVAIVAGLFVAKAPTTAISLGLTAAVNLGASSLASSMLACRVYYSTVQLEPSRALAYVEANRSKLVVYENILTNQYSNIPAGTASFSQLVQSGIKNPVGICIIPFMAVATVTTLNGANNMGFAPWQSCQDTCPATFSPCSITNLQVQLGGQNVLQGTQLFYNFENFLEQVQLKDKLTSSDLGIGCGVISQDWWEKSRVYWVDLSRSRESDKAATRNLSVSFLNNSNVPLDLMVFTVYLDKFVIDVETGLIRK